MSENTKNKMKVHINEICTLGTTGSVRHTENKSRLFLKGIESHI